MSDKATAFWTGANAALTIVNLIDFSFKDGGGWSIGIAMLAALGVWIGHLALLEGPQA